MAKKRDPRSTPSSSRRETRVHSSPQRHKRDDSVPNGSKLVTFSVIISSFIIIIVAYRLRQSSSPSQHNESHESQRNLVTIDANYQDILTVSSTKTTLWYWFHCFEKKRKKFNTVILHFFFFLHQAVSNVVSLQWIRKIQEYQKIPLSAITLILFLATLLPGIFIFLNLCWF